MNRRHLLLVFVLVGLLVMVGPVVGQPEKLASPDNIQTDTRLTASGITTRVSVASDGAEGNLWSHGISSISADVRYVAFSSGANNLVPDDTNGEWDVFVHNLETGQTRRISVASDGTQGNSWSYHPSISADGRYLAFQSDASNLVQGDTNGSGDVFAHDWQTGQTRRVSVASNGTQGNSGSSSPSISADGRYVAFQSDASNLVPDDTNGEWDVFVYDLETGQTRRVSVASNGTQGNTGSSSPSISADARYVAFQSDASNLVPGDTNGIYDIFVHDRQTGQTRRVSVASDGTQGNYESYHPSISADGRYVAFHSYASNLVPDDNNGAFDVFVHDRQTSQTRRVSVASDGTQGNHESYHPSISADGRYVAFQSDASNLVPGDTNGSGDVFAHDWQTAQTSLVSVASDGTQGHSSSLEPSISADGLHVAFTSNASNLVPDDTNSFTDVFFHTRGDTLDLQVDSDRDGLPDEWEIHGYDHDNDGVIDVNLPEMGADPFRKDIFVEIDYMVDPGNCLIGTFICFGGHSHRPNREAIEQVVQAFANAPVMNPDDSLGITLHVDFGPDSIMNPLTDQQWHGYSQSNSLPHQDELGTLLQWTTGNWWSFDEIKQNNFDPAREPIFHYAVFAHHLAGLGCTSGVSRGIPASDFVVTLGGWDGRCGTVEENPKATGSRKAQAGTFMHELGHNLGLRHGGDENLGYKPNYISTMNYAYQTRGIIIDGKDSYVDYSAFGPISIDENALDEAVGLNIGVYGVRYWCEGHEDLRVDSSSDSIDWNCDNKLDVSVQANVNGDKDNSGRANFTQLSNYNDWSNLIFTGGSIGLLDTQENSYLSTESAVIDELTEQEALRIPSIYDVSVTQVDAEWDREAQERITYSFDIANRGSVTDEYSIEVTSSQGWLIQTEAPGTILLAPGDVTTIEITLMIPADVTSEITDQLKVQVQSQSSANLSDSAEVLTTVSTEQNYHNVLLPLVTH